MPVSMQDPIYPAPTGGGMFSPFTGLGEDVSDLAGQLGIDTSQLGTVGADTNEPNVLLSWLPDIAFKPRVRDETELALARRRPVPTLAVAAKRPNVVPLSVAINNIYGWNEQQWNKLADRLVDVGMLPESWTRPDLFQAWETLVRQTANFNAAGQKVTPWDVIGLLSGGPGGGGLGTSPRTVVRKEVQLSSPDEAEAVLRQVLASALGRRPTDTELDSFTAQLNSAQRANPVVTTATYDASGYLTSSTSKGGVEAAIRAQDFAENSDEYGAYQAVATYFPMLEQAIQSPF